MIATMPAFLPACTSPVYLLEQPDGAERPVPCRACGESSAGTPARDFFRHMKPDGAPDVVAVRETRSFVGFVAFPSGWMATPWLVDADPEALRDRLEHAANVLLGRPALHVARGRDWRVPP